jgi:serine/threonine-protein kinase
MQDAATRPANAANAANAALDDQDVLPRLLGRYVLLRLMVRGGMGEVYLATTIGIEGAERPVVVKRIRREYKKDPSFLARFMDEARVQSQLDDPGVARIVEAAVDEHGDPYVAVEYVEGRSLADVRARLSRLGKALPWADAVAVTLEIASALAHVHERTGADGAPLGIVHRDLSPQNVMVGFSGDVKLIDFGTARGDNRRCHTVSGTVLAKPGYVAPEVARGESATPRADLYALGVMLWELVAGRRYLEGDANDHVAQVCSGKLRPSRLAGDAALGSLGDGTVPAELDRIIQWLTEAVPSARCGRAREAAQALAGLLGTAPRRPMDERSVRSRVKVLLARLYPTEPAASRVEFARLVARARRSMSEELTEAASPSPSPARKSPTPSGRLTGVPDGLPGTRYRLIRPLGEGAMGVVYEAEHVDLGRRVAVKILQSKHSSSTEFVARFRREARAIAGLAHPNLVQVYDFGQTLGEVGDTEWTGRLFFAMEKLDGETLEAYLDREKGLDWRDACELAIKTCRALEAAHASGLVHRDLKPGNLFLTYASKDGARPPVTQMGLKLLDFGVAKGSAFDGLPGDGKDPQLSCAGAIFGTPDTMSPEQISGGPVDGRADLYSLGCVLYNLLTGRTPFDAPSAILVMSAHLREVAVAPRAAAPERDIPEAVERVVLRALAKDAAGRYASAAEMREALEEACFGTFFVDANLDQGAAAQANEASASASIDVDFEVMDRGAAAAAAPTSKAGDEAAWFDADVARASVGGRDTAQGSDGETVPIRKPTRVRRALFATLVGAAVASVGALGVLGVLDHDARQHAVAPATQAAERGADKVMLSFAAHAAAFRRPTAAAAPAPNAMPAGAKSHELAPLPAPRANAAGATSPNDAASARLESKPAASAGPMPSTPPPLPATDLAAGQAEARLAAGDPDGALRIARLAKDDLSVPALRVWARAAYAAGRPGEAHQACLAWLAHAGDDTIEASLLDAKSLRAAGREDDAKDRLEEIVRAHPACVEARSMLQDLELGDTSNGGIPTRRTKRSAGPQKIPAMRRG